MSSRCRPIPECAQAIQAGRTDFDAFMTSGTVVNEAIAQGINVEKVGGPAFVENLAVALDKQAHQGHQEPARRDRQSHQRNAQRRHPEEFVTEVV